VAVGLFAMLIPITLFFLPETCPACIKKSERVNETEEDENKYTGKTAGPDDTQVLYYMFKKCWHIILKSHSSFCTVPIQSS
jgi:hypothetical protein